MLRDALVKSLQKCGKSETPGTVDGGALAVKHGVVDCRLPVLRDSV